MRSKLRFLIYLHGMKIIDKLALIDIKDRKVLCARSKGKSKYYIPGGKRELGESDEEALIREVQEELSVEIDPGSIKFYGNFQAQADGQPAGVEVKMQCYTASYAGNPTPSAEIDSISWLNQDDLKIIAPVDVLIFADLNSKELID